MFAFLAIAIALNAWAHRGLAEGETFPRDPYFWLYATISALMVVTAIVVFAIGKSWDHGVLLPEIIEMSKASPAAPPVTIP